MSANWRRRPKWRCARQRSLASWRILGRKRSPSLSPRGWFFSRLPMRGVGIGGIRWMLHKAMSDKTKILIETDTKAIFAWPNSLKPIPRSSKPNFNTLTPTAERTKRSTNTLSTSFSTVYLIGKPAGQPIPIAVLLKISAALFSSGQDLSTYPRTTSKDTVRVI